MIKVLLTWISVYEVFMSSILKILTESFGHPEFKCQGEACLIEILKINFMPDLMDSEFSIRMKLS